MKKSLIKALLIALTVLLIIVGSFALVLGIRPSVRPFMDEAGNELPGSIAILEELEINGMKQWISIRGKDRTNPVLFWLHPGPGSAQMSMSHYLDQELEEEYVIVHWDQRGAGKSNYSGFSEETMTIQQFKNDTVAILNYLQKKLEQEKIYLLGHSWGTQLGIELVEEYPEKFYGYVAVSQVVDHARAVEIASDWLRQEMKKANDQKGLETLDGLNNPAYYHRDYRQFARLAVSYGGNYDKSLLELALIAFRAPEYTIIDYYRLLDGMNRGGGPIHEDGIMTQFNYIDAIPKVEVPIYFFIGRNDYNTPFQLVDEYYNQIEAPVKKMIVFEDSAHTPFISETERFNNELLNILH